jgi:hypothetical protein
MRSPILFLIFNRPDVTRKVFNAIQSATPTRLYIAADGPRTTKVGEVELCEEVRQIITQVDWPCEIKTLFRSENLGCKKAVSSAITWFFKHEPEGIILEDDVVPSPAFFEFCDYALEKYRDDYRIGMVTGTNLLGADVNSMEYMYSQIFSIWGWATWKRAWDLYNVKMDAWPNKYLKDSLLYQYKPNLAEYFIKTFDSHVARNIDTWDAQWVYTCAFNSFMCITPKANMISNIGIVGTHSSVETANNNVGYGNTVGIHYIPPRSVSLDPYFDSKITQKIYRPALFISKMSQITKAIGVHFIAKIIYRIYNNLKKINNKIPLHQGKQK